MPHFVAIFCSYLKDVAECFRSRLQENSCLVVFISFRSALFHFFGPFLFKCCVLIPASYQFVQYCDPNGSLEQCAFHCRFIDISWSPTCLYTKILYAVACVFSHEIGETHFLLDRWSKSSPHMFSNSDEISVRYHMCARSSQNLFVINTMSRRTWIGYWLYFWARDQNRSFLN